MREEQITYAALDAYVLIEIYEKVKALYETMQNPFMDFNEFVHGFLFENKNKISVNRRNTQGAGNGNIPTKSQSRPSPNYKHQNPHQTRPHFRERDGYASKTHSNI